MSRRLRLALLGGLVCWVALALWLLLDPSPDPVWLQVEDVVGHGLLFAVGAAIGYALLLDEPGPRRWQVLTLGLGMAIGLEVIQAVIVRGRAGQVVDVVADAVGLILGIGAVAVVSRLTSVHFTRVAVACLAWVCVFGAIGAAAVDPAQVLARWRCRGVDAPLLEAGPEGVSPGPSFRQSGGQREVAGVTSVSQDGALVTAETEGLLCGAIRSDAFTIVATVSSADLEQEGPSRIVTFSVGTSSDEANVHLGQEADAASLRIRLGDESFNNEQVPDVFTDTDAHSVVFRYADGEAWLFRDGELIDDFDLDLDSIHGWNTGYPLLVGNEATGDRPFIGDIDFVAFYPRALSNEEVEILAVSRR